ncbi:Hypothetical predicted protein [Cloeon dipterum]|uniref:Uncharacterized protein n=1 Tax=Cloeon dipterum TaxID=197152 RepID=A0A8S1C2M8_9INSE|nr:Hypothetical predicted protein [Cloeon dipterum]
MATTHIKRIAIMHTFLWKGGFYQPQSAFLLLRSVISRRICGSVLRLGVTFVSSRNKDKRTLLQSVSFLRSKMKGFACLVASFLFLGVANALDCYTCDSDRQGEEYCSHVPFKKPSAEKVMSCGDSFTRAFNEFRSNFQGGQPSSQLDSCVKHTYSDGKDF